MVSHPLWKWISEVNDDFIDSPVLGIIDLAIALFIEPTISSIMKYWTGKFLPILRSEFIWTFSFITHSQEGEVITGGVTRNVEALIKGNIGKN